MSPSVKARKRSLQSMKSKLFEEFLDVELSEVTRIKRLLHFALKIVVMVGRDFIQNLVKLQAMALAFKTLLSLAPLLAVVFSLLKAFGVHNRMEPALAEALAPLGEKGAEITVHLIGFVNKMSAGALGSVGLVTLFITVLSLMGTIEEAFNHIWRVKSPRKLARRFSDYLSAILVGPILVFAAVTITATLQNNAIVQSLLSLQALGAVILFLLRLVPYITLWGAFTFVYMFIPNTHVRLRSAVVGGLVAAVLWQTVGWGFAVFVASSTRYYVIYSSFAILLLFLLWLHIGWLIVLLGAQVAYAHQHIHFYLGDRELLAQTPAGREKLALHLMLLIGRNFYHGRDPLNVAEIAAQLRLPAGIVKEFMVMFANLKLVLPLAEEDTYVLARAPETIAVKEILDGVRNSGKSARAQRHGSKEESVINDILLDVDKAAAKVLEGKNLQALLLG
ncbi:MAG TPA: YhjD/YihY/BrkB family envelope integrity protein [Candidatus Binatia bacterium]|jgi:membrane protein